MPYKTVKQSCTRSDGKKGKYVLKYKPKKKTSKKKDSKGYVKAGCHTSKKSASAQRAAIEGPREGASSMDEVLEEVDEGKKWSKERKSQIDCNNPKGFSERAHCDSKKKNESIRRMNMNLRKRIRQIIIEHVCACEDEGIERPIPGVAYPIEIEEIIVDPITDLIMAAEEMSPEQGDLEASSITFHSDDLSYPDIHHEDDGRMFDYGHTKSDSHEGRMTRAKLYRMGKMAQSFHDRLEDGDDLPEWVQDKVTTAEDRLRSAYEYIEYKLHRMERQGTMCNENTVRKLVRNYLGRR